MKIPFEGFNTSTKSVVLGEARASEEVDFVFPSEEFSRQAHVSSIHKYVEMYGRSVEDPAGFWSDIASDFYWKEKWGQSVYTDNLDIRKGKVNIEWFKGGKTNICYNCLDRNIDAGNGDKFAIFWEGNEFGRDATLTYTQLFTRVCQLSRLKMIG
ncbi:Acetyl-coenzyme A synthetase, cytoplasmic [Datura stramonium]|uniref:Acetyl-coenzyme A synthetase, cytoplasmic n=1 Tax=Datura stramonium TaxID=4076 RepID=A0ABS8VFB5_DATST|nr:Acetyl-coenzyme A synthetase, cytoplasmic [Datura stramonium]